MRADDRGDAREASFRGIGVSPVPCTRTRDTARTCDCFGSPCCRGNANSHARGDIHNTMPLITHCLCDGAALLPPPPLFSLSFLFLSLLSHALPHAAGVSPANADRATRANHNKICNAYSAERCDTTCLYYFSSTSL